MQNIVFNGHYLMYFDTAVADYWRALALPYDDAMRRLQGDLFVRKATVEYHASARFDDLLDVGMPLRAHRQLARCSFGGALFRGERAAGGRRAGLRVRRPGDADARSRCRRRCASCCTAYEAGEPMFEVAHRRLGRAGRASAGALRTEVFARSSASRPRWMWDEADAGALHAVAYNRLGLPLATGRLVERGDGVAQIGRMAVRQRDARRAASARAAAALRRPRPRAATAS